MSASRSSIELFFRIRLVKFCSVAWKMMIKAWIITVTLAHQYSKTCRLSIEPLAPPCVEKPVKTPSVISEMVGVLPIKRLCCHVADVNASDVPGEAIVFKDSGVRGLFIQNILLLNAGVATYVMRKLHLGKNYGCSTYQT